LLILRLIWVLFGLLKTLEGPMGTPNQFFYFLRVVLVVIYILHAYFSMVCSIIHKK
jgi:hypothetical protein